MKPAAVYRISKTFQEKTHQQISSPYRRKADGEDHTMVLAESWESTRSIENISSIV